MEKSHVPVDHGHVNPAFARMVFALSQRNDLLALVKTIQDVARQRQDRSGEDFVGLKRQLLDAGVKHSFDTMFHAFKVVHDSPPMLGAPPPTSEVYGRIERGQSVIDIGTGNGSKIVRYSGTLKITAVDPELNLHSSYTVDRIKGPVESLFPLPPGTFCTSFMSLCQLERASQEVVLQRDGLHLLPDHEALLITGAARRTPEGIVVSTPSRDYLDKDLPPGGYPIITGYRLLASFEPVRLTVKLTSVETVEYTPISVCSPLAYEKFDLSDVGPKVDGMFHELEVKDGLAFLVNRAGLQQSGSSDFTGHLCLHLESFPDCHVLIRIVSYRGFIPPHSGDVMRDFVRRVRIKVDGKPVCGPPIWQPGIVKAVFEDVSYYLPSDGLISRMDGKDYYCKYQWTMDITDRQACRLREKLNSNGFALEIDLRSGLWQYGINRVGNIVKAEPMIPRTDKFKTTSFDTILHLVSTPVLSDMVALQ